MVVYFTPRRYAFTPPPEADSVVVVGAGPVGLALALGLARRGVRVTVLEAGDSVCAGSRAICLSRHSLEVLERLGVGDRFAELSLPWTSGRSYYRDTEVLSFDMPSGAGDVHPPMVNISQSVAEQVLVDAIEATDGCEVHWRCRVLDCTRHDDHAVLEVGTPQGPARVRADWVVAADGARSAVREALGLRLDGTSYEGRYVIADIHWPAALPTERRVWFDPPSNPGSTIILHRQPDDIWRVDYQLQPGADPELEADEQRVRERIARHLDWLGNDRPWTLEWTSLYRAHALSLGSYRHGRVLFAGDAAHLVPIFGVRGLNSGLEDADVLAWMLAAVVDGEAAPALLDVYATERRDAWCQNVTEAEKSTLFMTPGTRGYELTRDAVLALATRRPALRELVNPRQSSATHSRTSPLTLPCDAPGLRPGDPVPDRVVRTSTGTSSLNSLRGRDFALLGFGVATAELGEAVSALAGRTGVGVRGLATGAGREHPAVGALDDADGALAAEFGARPGEVFAIRPDGLLLGRLPDFSGPGEVADLIVTGGHR
ncbi:FAD-dependent oxidoreductase [Saccharopolyspora erythraea]|uniref:FAD-dependent oxidoreductase n=1 Tax=Saccharopolyspora erythraea TaxID=1836 RepID=UPI00201223B6|nr:FAD-dependent oxidoreductase [Saccharopolyspora erythraea]